MSVFSQYMFVSVCMPMVYRKGVKGGLAGLELEWSLDLIQW